MTTTSDQPVAVLQDRCFLEGPRWHEGRLWASDIYAHEVISVSADGSDVRVEAELDGWPVGLGFLPDGRLLISVMDHHTVLRRESSGEIVVHATIPEKLGHLGDMIVDADGTAYVGAIGYDPTAGGVTTSPGFVARIDPGGAVSVAADELAFPNGMVITPDRRLIVAESFGNCLTEFDIADDGSLSDRRLFARFGPRPSSQEIPKFLPQLAVTPDGICLDDEGAIWVADPERRRAIRIDADGAIVAQVDHQHKLFACALGGADGDTLYLCAAPDSSAANREQEHAGELLKVPAQLSQ